VRRLWLAPDAHVSGDERSDAELLAAAARGDDSAFGILVRRYIRAATLLAAQFVGDPSEAEDMVQDAFMVVHRKARRFDADRPFGPWLFAIVRRLSANRRARDVRRAWLLRLWGSRARTEAATPAPEPPLVAGLDAEAAKRALEALPSMQRACFDLVVVRELSIEEVAAMHNISESTVRQHVFRARRTLRDVLKGTSDGEP
jgi:RNA polymerase sigma-70 factor (ECF subfamily)